MKMKRKLLLGLVGGVVFFGGMYLGSLGKPQPKTETPIKKEVMIEKKIEKSTDLVRNKDYCGERIFVYFDEGVTTDQVKGFLKENDLKLMIYFDKIGFSHVKVPEGSEIYWVENLNKNKDDTIVKEACLDYLINSWTFNN